VRIAIRQLGFLVAVIAGLALAGWGVFQVLHPSVGPTIKTVSAQRLSEAGVVLINPFPWDQAAVTRGGAEQAAMKLGPGGPVLQSALSEVLFTGLSAKQPRLCWVVSLPGSLAGSHGPIGSPQRTASFYLVFIDAQTGEFIQGTAGG
jgi:hypothetical protein